MTALEILQGIIRHRGNPIADNSLIERQRKDNEIEWALHALAEYLVNLELENR